MIEAVKLVDTKNAYKLLPRDFTRYTLVNKQYKNNRFSAITGESLRNLFGVAGMFAFAYGAINPALTFMSGAILNHLASKKYVDAKDELKPAYNAIVNRAKKLKAWKEFNAQMAEKQ